MSKAKLTIDQNRVEIGCVSALREILPRGFLVVILADRGFARVPFFSSWGDSSLNMWLGPKQRYVWNLKALRERLGHWKVSRGTKTDLGVVSYHKTERWPVRMVICFDGKQREPWFLAMNAKDEPLSRIIAWYGLRMEVEEFFKDLKHERGGFKLRGLVLSSAWRYSRLLLVMAYAYYLLTVIISLG